MHPELARLHLFGLDRPIYSYGALMVAGMALGLAVAVGRARRFGVERFDVLAVGLLGIAGGLAGGALLFIAIHPALFVEDPTLLERPGLVWYGGLLGGAGAALAYCRGYGVPLGRVADAAAPGLALGHAVGRIGCLLGGCCYGRPVAASFPLAVDVAGGPRHPTQLYEAAGLVALALATALVPASTARKPGVVFTLYLAGYALLRFVVEHWRGDDFERGFVVPGLVSISQAIAAVVFGAAAVVLYRLARKGAA